MDDELRNSMSVLGFEFYSTILGDYYLKKQKEFIIF